MPRNKAPRQVIRDLKDLPIEELDGPSDSDLEQIEEEKVEEPIEAPASAPAPTVADQLGIDVGSVFHTGGVLADLPDAAAPAAEFLATLPEATAPTQPAPAPEDPDAPVPPNPVWEAIAAKIDPAKKLELDTMNAMLAKLEPQRKQRAPKAADAAKAPAARNQGTMATLAYKFFRALEDPAPKGAGLLKKDSKRGSLKGLFTVANLEGVLFLPKLPEEVVPGASGKVGTVHSQFCWARNHAGQLLVDKVYNNHVEAVMLEMVAFAATGQ